MNIWKGNRPHWSQGMWDANTYPKARVTVKVSTVCRLLERIRGIWNAHTCWWDCKMGQMFSKTVQRYLRRLNILPAIPLLPTQETWVLLSLNDMYKNVRCSIICNMEKPETTQMSIYSRKNNTLLTYDNRVHMAQQRRESGDWHSTDVMLSEQDRTARAQNGTPFTQGSRVDTVVLWW